MAGKTVNPTRMELTRLKGRLKTARRGHKLLKDKRDELMKQFMDVVRRNRALRAKVEQGLKEANAAFTVAAALMSPEMLEQSLLYPKQSVELDMTFQNIMSVDVPQYHFRTHSQDPGEIYPYGFANTSGELDDAVSAMSQVFQDMLKLAEIEKTSQLLAEEIEKTRRRVNALEYVKIPEMQENIKYITMKLDENERANTIRLMKVKELLLRDAIEERREADAKAVEAFLYWQDMGLLRIVEQEPLSVEYLSVQAGPVTGGTRKYAPLVSALRQVCGARVLTPGELSKIYDWIEVFGLEEAAAVMLVRRCMELKGPSVKIQFMDKMAREWAKEGVLTAADAEQRIKLDTELQGGAKAILARWRKGRMAT